MDFAGEVFGDSGDQSHFAVLGRAEGDDAGAQLLAKAVDKLPKSFAVNILHFGGNNLNAFNKLHVGSQFVNLPQSSFALPRFQILFKLPHGVRQLFDLGEDGVFADVELAGQLSKRLGLLLVVFEGANAGDGFDAAHSGGHGLLAYDFQHADIAHALDVRTAAQFLGVEAAGRAGIGNGHHADVRLGILVAEEGQRAGVQRLFERGHAGFDLRIQADFVVHLLLDVAQLFGTYVREVRKVEAQPFGRVQRAGLLHVRAQDVSQGGVHQMCASVIADDAGATFGVGGDRNAVAHPQRVLGHHPVRYQSGNGVERTSYVREF